MIKMKRNEKVLLLSKHATFLVFPSGSLNTQFGKIDLNKIRYYGQKIKSKNGYEFYVVKPMIIDYLRKCKRGPQIIMPKDAASIISVTGLGPGWKCLDAGGGSGFLALFIAFIVGDKGSVTTYEKNKKNARIIEENIKLCNLKNIKVKNKDFSKFTEKNLDLITLDMKGAEKLITKVHKALNPGGWVVIYSPHIEQQKEVMKRMQKKFVSITTIENIQRQWQVSDFTHPVPSGILHTGFLTFGRKV